MIWIAPTERDTDTAALEKRLYYDDPHDATGRFDFVPANPPFNANPVDKERLKDMVGYGPHGNAGRFPFGIRETELLN